MNNNNFRIGVLACLLLASCTAAKGPENLPEADATAKLQTTLAEISKQCLAPPIGNGLEIMLEPSDPPERLTPLGQGKLALTRDIDNWSRAGIVKVDIYKRVPKSFDQVATGIANVKLADGVNVADMHDLNGRPCMKIGTSTLTKIAKIDYLKDGKTLWNAAIVTALEQNPIILYRPDNRRI